MGVKRESGIYYPFFRGKQYELITIRENARLLKDCHFVPIIEPVSESLTGLGRALAETGKVGGAAIVIINPKFGDHVGDGKEIEALLNREFSTFKDVSIGVLVRADHDLDQIQATCSRHSGRDITLIHAGYTNGKALAARVDVAKNVRTHVFQESSGKLYRKHFHGTPRVLIRDGFQKRSNSKYPPLEPFSDLHATYREEGMDGFGDFLVVGDDFSESGGPAYAVAIHLTCIDREKDDEMFIHHFISDRSDTPTDPGGKFAEALEKLAREANREDTSLLRTRALGEFLDLHRRGHFPGLGYVKKLSMQHHIETFSQYFHGRCVATPRIAAQIALGIRICSGFLFPRRARRWGSAGTAARGTKC